MSLSLQKFSAHAKIKHTVLYLIDLLSLGLMYVKNFTSFCQVLKKMHAKENWFFFSVSWHTKADFF